MKHYNHKSVIGHWTKVDFELSFELYELLQRHESHGRFYMPIKPGEKDLLRFDSSPYLNQYSVYFERPADATWFMLQFKS